MYFTLATTTTLLFLDKGISEMEQRRLLMAKREGEERRDELRREIAWER